MTVESDENQGLARVRAIYQDRSQRVRQLKAQGRKFWAIFAPTQFWR